MDETALITTSAEITFETWWQDDNEQGGRFYVNGVCFGCIAPRPDPECDWGSCYEVDFYTNTPSYAEGRKFKFHREAKEYVIGILERMISEIPTPLDS